MSAEFNPFSELIGPAAVHHDSGDLNYCKENDVIQEIFLISCTREPHTKPCLLLIGDTYQTLTLESLDQILFDRLNLASITPENVISTPECTEADYLSATQLDPIVYLFDCYCRSLVLFQKPAASFSADSTTELVKPCHNQIFKQAALFLLLDVELGSDSRCQSLFRLLFDNSGPQSDVNQVGHLDAFMAGLVAAIQSQSDEEDVPADALVNLPMSDSQLNAFRPMVRELTQRLKELDKNEETTPAAPPNPLQVALGLHRRPKPKVGRRARLLFLPERNTILNLTTWLAKYPVTAQLLVEASFPSTATPSGSDFEDGLFGRLLVPSHLCPLQSMEDSLLAIQGPNSASNSWAGEFFVESVPIKPAIEADQRNIWQITKDNDERLCALFKNLLRAGKQRKCVKNALLRWFGQCLHANKARKQLSHTMVGLPGAQSNDQSSAALASDGFLTNLAALLVRLCGPLITSQACLSPSSDSKRPHPLSLVWPSYVNLPKDTAFLPDLAEETRLTHSASAAGCAIPKPLDAYPLISHLFFLAHAALRLSFAPLLSLHFETNRQLHQMEQEAQLLNPFASPWGGGMSEDTPQGRAIRYCLRERTSRFLEQTTSLGSVDRLHNFFALCASTCRLLFDLARPPCASQSTKEAVPEGHDELGTLPELIVDNVVELISYLRRLNDDFIESPDAADVPLQPFLQFCVVYMMDLNVLSNPHLRARLGEVLETLIPQRYEENWNSQRTSSGFGIVPAHSFVRREQLLSGGNDSEQLSHVVTALLTAFVSIELAPGVDSNASDLGTITASASGAASAGAQQATPSSEAMETATVSFEEKFHYRRPMYACLRYWHGKPFYDEQFKRLEEFAIKHIDSPRPPLLLQFLSLLINDATFLLDEAIGLLAQIKQKEREREAAGGRFPRREDEGLFLHTGQLARFHITLGLDTIFALRRVVSLCPHLVTHPVLVDRIACMLNYFLLSLVGPKQGDLKVRDKSTYGFRPDVLVVEICKIYITLGLNTDAKKQQTAAAFRRAVVNDGRSYTTDLLDQALVVLNRVSNSSDLPKNFELVANALRVSRLCFPPY
uniref:RING-type E3 ubiquitin transferase n=4 Tax=Schistocephalus solidus TaxID=70667 RepID=A0A0X3Q132_SCHSO